MRDLEGLDFRQSSSPLGDRKKYFNVSRMIKAIGDREYSKIQYCFVTHDGGLHMELYNVTLSDLVNIGRAAEEDLENGSNN